LMVFCVLAASPPRPPLFPYTTLFRSRVRLRRMAVPARRRRAVRVPARQAFVVGEHRVAADDVLVVAQDRRVEPPGVAVGPEVPRSEEHTSELQSRENLVCRLLLEKKK